MKFVIIALFAYMFEWAFSEYQTPEMEWTFLLGNKYFIISMLATALLVESKHRSLLIRSVLAVLVLTVYADFANFILKRTIDEDVDFSIINALVFLGWLFFTIKRKYPDFIDSLGHDTVNILILRPKSTFDVIKGLVGFPAASICIYAGGFVWTFRKHSGKFERLHPSYVWLDEHLVVNTGVLATPEILKELEKIVGESRVPYCKCVYSIRHVLNMLGSKYTVKWCDYIPGIYALKILKR